MRKILAPRRPNDDDDDDVAKAPARCLTALLVDRVLCEFWMFRKKRKSIIRNASLRILRLCPLRSLLRGLVLLFRVFFSASLSLHAYTPYPTTQHI